MTRTPSTPPLEVTRRNSVIRREVRDGVPVYVKQSQTQDWEASAAQIRERSSHEADVLRRIAESGRFHGRLGATDLIASQPEEAIIITREVPGRPLQEFLLTSYRRDPNQDCLRALLLAGRWLNAFQQLPVCAQDLAPLSEHSPHDHVEYCAIRLRKLSDLGYRGLNPDAQQRLLKAVQDGIECSSADDRRHVLCHGDFAAFNVLWDSHVLTGIDLTQAQTSAPLLDVTYFLHRLELLPIYFPWKHWPVDLWRRAFLKGYGRPAAAESPMYRALMIRHLLCRLQTYVRRPRAGWRDRLHTPWVIHHVRRRLLQAIEAN
ncbi:MAG: phosphotransferase [Planctomycetaceae bacterium]